MWTEPLSECPLPASASSVSSFMAQINKPLSTRYLPTGPSPLGHTTLFISSVTPLHFYDVNVTLAVVTLTPCPNWHLHISVGRASFWPDFQFLDILLEYESWPSTYSRIFNQHPSSWLDPFGGSLSLFPPAALSWSSISSPANSSKPWTRSKFTLSLKSALLFYLVIIWFPPWPSFLYLPHLSLIPGSYGNSFLKVLGGISC